MRRIKRYMPAALVVMLSAVVVALSPPPAARASGLDAPDGPGPPCPYTPGRADRGAGRDRQAEGMLFSFAAIADSHIFAYPEDDFRHIKAISISRELLANFVRDINQHVPPVDFTVHLGDVTESGASEEFAQAGAILDSLECPLYPVVGNHDNFQNDAKQAWMKCFGLDSTHYAFERHGLRFIVIDCTPQPYDADQVRCDSLERAWVERELAANSDMPTIILSHYNMWERGWCATFDTTCHYQEYEGMALLRQVLEEAGNVVAVINGHVHANRVEVHNGIYYIDINATLVGMPSIRYFYVYPDRIEVDYEYISDGRLLTHVQSLCRACAYCFNPYAVCRFIDGGESDKRFTIPCRSRAAADAEDARPTAVPPGPGAEPDGPSRK